MPRFRSWHGPEPHLPAKPEPSRRHDQRLDFNPWYSLTSTKLLPPILQPVNSTSHNADPTRRPPAVLRGDLRPSRKFPRDRGTPIQSTLPPFNEPKQITNPPSPLGQEPPNPRLLTTLHVHLLRDPHPDQHPGLQAAQLGRAPPLQRLRVLPRHPRARERARHDSAAAREGEP